MSAKQVILWRHGQTAYNVEGRVQGHVDIPLNEAGHEQARAAATILRSYAPVSIISSDLLRAQQTGQALADALDVELRTDTRLRERSFGSLEGLTAKEMRADYASEYGQWKNTGEAVTAGVEMRRDVGRRVAAAISEAAAGLESTRTLVVVSHGSAITQGLVTLLGMDASTWSGIRGLSNCHWSVIVPYTRVPHWRLAAHNIGVRTK